MIKTCYFKILLLLLLAAAPAFSQTYFSARLSEPPDSSGGQTNTPRLSGTAAFALDREGVLRYYITLVSTTNNDTLANPGDIITSIEFRHGSISDTGRVLMSINSGFSGNTYSGSWNVSDQIPLTDEVKNILSNGKLFLVVVTDSSEARGQIMPASGTGFVAHLTGPQESVPVYTDASGTGSFLLTDVGLIYMLSVQGLAPQAAHFHWGLPGVSGPVVKDIIFEGSTAFGIWQPGGAEQPLADSLKRALLVEELYVNVHTPQHPTGEIRGQVLHAGGFGLSAQWITTDTLAHQDSLAQEDSLTLVPTRLRAATASFVLADAGLIYHYNYSLAKDDTSRTQVSVFLVDQTGGRVRLLGSVDSTFSGVWLKDGMGSPITGQNISDLLTGKMSLSLQTAADTLYSDTTITVPVTFHAGSNFSALLNGSQEIPRHFSDATGLGHFVLTQEGLRYHITVEGISNITGAHFHLGEMGINGAVVRTIDFDSNYVAEGVWSRTDSTEALTEALVDSLLTGRIYVNVHTPEFPAGEVRGQVLLSSGTNFATQLTGLEEIPPVPDARVRGTANFVLTDEGLIFKITADSLNITSAHFHLGAPGVSGPPVRSITEFSHNTAVGVWRTNDQQPLTQDLIRQLYDGNIYVNFHTPEHPLGEIRGQIAPNGGMGFVTVFDTSNTQSPSETNIIGAGVFTLTKGGLIYNFAADRGDIASASFNMGGSSLSVFDIEDSTLNGASGHGAWVFPPDTTIVQAVSALVTNGLYLGLMTNGNQEIRGLITPSFAASTVYVPVSRNVPESFRLEQNYPNPFNPTTTIRFALPERAAVKLTVYNVLGQEVATLINAQMEPGTYNAEFKASPGISSGIYFYNIKYGSKSITKKMMLVK